MRILLVEDDRRVSAAVSSVLQRRGYAVEHVATATAALAAAPCDLVLLDLDLPDGDGLDVCRELRARDADLGIIAVTARGAERDRVTGLRVGADDYVVKPFSVPELQARVEALLRRVGRRVQPDGDAVECGPLRVDYAARTVTVNGEAATLTRKEFDILASLARQPGAAVSNERLLLDVWQSIWAGKHTLQVHVASLRSKLGQPERVETVRGVGYRLRPD